MQDCIFCKIIAREIPSDIIFEDDQVFAFMDIRPVSRGHALIVPKKHSADIVDTEDATLAEVIVKAKKIAAVIESVLGADGFTVSTNRGEAAGQSVFHLHFHLIPRYKQDGLKPWTHHEVEPKKRAELAELIRKNL